MRLPIRARVPAIDVGEAARVEEGVVQGGGENLFLGVGGALDGDAGQSVRPELARLAAHAGEIPIRDIVFQVRPSALHADEGDASLHQDPLVLGRGELGEEAQVVALQLAAPFDDFGRRDHVPIALGFNRLAFPRPTRGNLRRPHAEPRHGQIELGAEMDRVIGLAIAVAPTSPRGRALHPAFNRVVVHHPNELARGGPTHSAGQVHLNSRLVGLRKGEPQNSGAGRGGQFGPNPVVVQGHGVITRLGDFIAVTEPRTIAILRALKAPFGLELADRGHDEEVPKLAVPADPAHVRETKPFDGFVGIGVTGAVVSARDRVRGELHQSERRGGAGKGLAEDPVAAPRADDRIDPVDQVLRLRRSRVLRPCAEAQGRGYGPHQTPGNRLAQGPRQPWTAVRRPRPRSPRRHGRDRTSCRDETPTPRTGLRSRLHHRPSCSCATSSPFNSSERPGFTMNDRTKPPSQAGAGPPTVGSARVALVGAADRRHCPRHRNRSTPPPRWGSSNATIRRRSPAVGASWTSHDDRNTRGCAARNSARRTGLAFLASNASSNSPGAAGRPEAETQFLSSAHNAAIAPSSPKPSGTAGLGSFA